MIATAGRLASINYPYTQHILGFNSKGFRFALLEACSGIEITHKTFTILKKTNKKKHILCISCNECLSLGPWGRNEGFQE